MMKQNRLQFLEEQHDFVLPNLFYDTLGDLNVYRYNDEIVLSIKGTNWMVLNLQDYREVYEVFSHVSISKGSVLCSGMGFLLRESWLVNKGFDVTVVENNLDLINYHKTYNPDLCSKMTIINDDIHNISGKYTTILLDHYEYESQDEILMDVIEIVNKLECELVWFWPLERFVENHHYRKNGGWEFYQYLRKKIPNLPKLTKIELFTFLEIYYSHRNYQYL